MSKMINALGQVTEGNEESLDAVVGVGLRRLQLRHYRRFRQEPQPRARVAPGATAMSQRVVIRISDRQGGQPNVTIFDGKMTEEQLSRLRQSIQSNTTRSQDWRTVLVYVKGRGPRGAGWGYSVTPTFAVNLRRLYSRRTNAQLRGTPETEAPAEPKEIIAE